MLLVARAGREREVAGDLRALGPRRGGGRARDRRRAHARALARRAGRRHPGRRRSRTRARRARPARARARRSARAPEARPRASVAPEADLAGALRALLDTPNLGSKRVDLPPVRPARAGQHRDRPGRRRGARARSSARTARRRARRSRSRSTATRAGAGSIPYAGTVAAVAEAARNVACTGARPLALTNCLNFGNPERPEIMWEFAEATRGLGDAARALGTPVVSGNVSFYNETHGPRDPPDADDRRGRRCSTTGSATPPRTSRAPGYAIVLLGENREELGGSEWLALRRGLERGVPPRGRSRARAAARTSCCVDGVAAGADRDRARRRRRRARRGARGVLLRGPAQRRRARRARRLAAARRAAVRRVDRARDRGDAPTPARCSRSRARHGVPARAIGTTGGERLRDRAAPARGPGSTSRSTRCTRSGRARFRAGCEEG